MLSHAKAILKRSVLSSFWNFGSPSVSLSYFGNWFHKYGAAYLKDLEANVLCLMCGWLSNKPASFDLRFLSHFFLMLIRS